MKIRALIKKLQKLEEKYGNKKVLVLGEYSSQLNGYDKVSPSVHVATEDFSIDDFDYEEGTVILSNTHSPEETW